MEMQRKQQLDILQTVRCLSLVCFTSTVSNDFYSSSSQPFNDLKCLKSNLVTAVRMEVETEGGSDAESKQRNQDGMSEAMQEEAAGSGETKTSQAGKWSDF